MKGCRVTRSRPPGRQQALRHPIRPVALRRLGCARHGRPEAGIHPKELRPAKGALEGIGMPVDDFVAMESTGSVRTRRKAWHSGTGSESATPSTRARRISRGAASL
jgi:hypothetical protein